MGVLNLWAGNYRDAALCYYNYINKRNGQNSSYPVSTNSINWSDDKFTISRDGYSTYTFSSEEFNSTGELITMIPGDSIPSEGNYSELQDIFSCNANNQYYIFPDNEGLSGAERINYQIGAVEDLIINENALETSFEGYRFYDLMRVALRRGDASYLADRVYGRRGSQRVGEMKSLIKCDLNNSSNWYLKWNGKIGIDIE